MVNTIAGVAGVRDNTGAVVPKADVTLTDVGTLNSLHTTTNAEGEYLIAAVPPGTYDLTISVVGFSRFESKGIILVSHNAPAWMPRCRSARSRPL